MENILVEHKFVDTNCVTIDKQEEGGSSEEAKVGLICCNNRPF